MPEVTNSRDEPVIECRCLGPLEVEVGDGPVPRELAWRKNLGLLLYLGRSPGRRRSRAHLLGLLWGEKPESAARHSLNEALRVIRRVGGDRLVRSDGDHVVLDEGGLRLDTDRLERELEAGRWEAAAGRVRGDFLEGFEIPDSSPFEDWLAAERVRWRRRSVQALVGRAESLLSAGDVAAGAAMAQRARALDPVSNAAVRAAMRAAALAGERAEALERYGEFETRLAEQLGVEPDPETTRLADRVRRERTWRLPPALRAEETGRRGPLVGRDEELSDAIEAWRRGAREERAVALFVDGDPGVGKTRFVEEILARARLEGAILAGIRAVPSDVESPWSGALGLCRGGLLEAPGVGLSPPSALAAVAREIGEWAERFADEIRGVEPAPLDRALGGLVGSVAVEQPVLLFVDDAQWLDSRSAAALGALLRDLEKRPLALVLAASGQPAREDLDELRARLGRDVSGRVFRLGPLSREAVRALGRRLFPDLDPAALDRLTRRIEADSAGLPLLAVELLDAVRLGLELEGEATAWPAPHRTLDQTRPGQLPDPIVAAIRIGFRRLSENARQVLAAGSVLGERVTRADLQRATGLAEDEVALALDELEWQRWLVSEARGYSFVARIVREVVGRDMLTPGQRRRIREAAGGG